MEYSWALLLLAIFVLCIFFFTIIMIILYYYNKKQKQTMRKRVENQIIYGSSISSNKNSLQNDRFDFNKSSILYGSQVKKKF